MDINGKLYVSLQWRKLLIKVFDTTESTGNSTKMKKFPIIFLYRTTITEWVSDLPALGAGNNVTSNVSLFSCFLRMGFLCGIHEETILAVLFGWLTLSYAGVTTQAVLWAMECAARDVPRRQAERLLHTITELATAAMEAGQRIQWKGGDRLSCH